MKTTLLPAALAAFTTTAMGYPFASPQTVRHNDDTLINQTLQAVADFDRDGRADALVSVGKDLFWMRSNGNGTFTQAKTFTFDSGTINRCRVADFDADGDPDIAVALRYDVRMVILRNDGGFQFTKTLDALLAGFDRDAAVITADRDHDGDIDVGVYHYEYPKDFLAWAHNDGKGTFAAPVDVLLGTGPNAAETADFNGDGRVDIISGSATLLPEMGNPPGGQLTAPSVYFGTPIADQLATGDVDRDGNPDLFVQTGAYLDDSMRLSWCRWAGTQFETARTIHAHSSGVIAGVCVTDVDEDGDVDVVFSDIPADDSPEQRIMWARNEAGQFLAPTVLVANNYGSRVMSGDVDGDGDTDLVWGNSDDALVSLNQAIHRTAEFTSVTVPTPLHGQVHLCNADVNGDGKEDLIWSSSVDNTVTWSTGTTFWPAGTSLGNPALITNAATGVSAIAAGDLNHDGRCDIAIAAAGLGQVQIAYNQGASWVTGYAAPLPAGTARLTIADVDCDNNPDIVISHANGVTLLRNTAGTGDVWTTETPSNLIKNVADVRPLQFNGTGRLELMACTVDASPRRCRIYRCEWNPVSASWKAAVPLYDGDAISALLAAGDITRDNLPDLVYATDATVNAATNVNNTSLSAPKPLSAMPGGLRSATLADLNNDGAPDLVTAGSGTVLFSRGKGDGTFFNPVTLLTNAAEDYSRMALYDFELDGDLDIALLEQGAGQIRILRNHLGQFDLTEQAPAPVVTAVPGTAAGVMQLQFAHAGRQGDAALAIRTFRLRLLKAAKNGQGQWVAGDGLTTAEATALLSSVEVYRDNGAAGVFEQGTDTLLGSAGPATSIGYMTVTPAVASQPLLIAGPGQSLRFLVRLNFIAAAGSSAVRDLIVEHITDTAAAGSQVVHSGLTENWRLDPQAITEAAPRVHLPGELENWRYTHWTTYESSGAAANDADPDNDGRSNLVEYVAGTNPKAFENTAAVKPVLDIKGVPDARQLWLQLRSPARPDVTVALEFAESTATPVWKTVSKRIGGGAWLGSPAMQSIKTENGMQTLLLVDGPPLNPAPRGFYRLRVSE